MNTQLTIDLKAVAYCRFYYQNQDGSKRRTKPIGYSVHGVSFNPDAYAPTLMMFPKESNFERARRLEVLDVWEARCQYQFRNSHSLVFRGEKAVQMWKIYNAHTYGNK